MEYAQECYCGNSIQNENTKATASDCDLACSGNSSEICGAGNRLSVYWSGEQPPPPPEIVPSVGLWESLGCYNDSIAARTRSIGENVDNATVESCTAACYNAGYTLAGLEYSTQCFCDVTIRNFGGPAASSDCDMTCAGNSSEYCGGPNRLNLYNYTGMPPPPPSTPPAGGGNTGSSVEPVTSGLPMPWNYSGCWVDNANGRILANQMPGDTTNMTIGDCVGYCASQNYTLAGAEYSTECYCGNDLINGATPASDTDCNMACGGNSTSVRAVKFLSVYTSTGNVTALPVPVVLNTSLPGQWQYQGCLIEGSSERVFPYEIDWATNNTVEACLTQCATFGYPAAGLEYGEQCFCGDVWDVPANSGGFAAESQCNMACSGDPIHLCGGESRLSLYYWDQTSDPLYVWHTPDNIGQYEFLIGGIVIPLVATVGINNKVSFVEKYGTGPPNSTGAYELDVSLTDNYQLAWREMHVKTDVFCSASLVLPDKAARQLNVGGWSLSSTFGVRLYAPDGSPGVNGTNDWEENVNELSLQQGRWYPSAMVMSNGSVLVVGGEAGSNGAPIPTLEILPRIPGGDTTIYLDYLNRTDPNNLYPFLFVLPSGNIFIGYYNEARILDPVTFATLQVLPNMPGSVTSFEAGRTYPMEGTAVLLPQHAPYTDPMEVLVCGGSNFGVALDNCVSIAPEAENATWTIERMPSKRVMSCMVALPDGTFMIMNGAQAGVAGFGLGDDPNLGALLYDPSLPIHQRISVLNTTIVARLYHSEATLLPDGRVLVTGSDPETNWPNGTAKFPQEYRMEVYIPPYLNQGYRQPEFNITETDWEYNGQYQITVKLYQADTSTMRVSLLAASSSTHGNMFGGRTIFPEFSCSGNVCTITAPPNAFVSPPSWHQVFILDGPTPSHSQWVRIGGDPGMLGHWPDYPDFTLPGV
ncbi:copper radical oxidase [Heliocybe sulcata]|uniref:Copper radical oxidase n=1 Tax=Heliocybe sulcata TaxID=5364 RepID=A0A5C3N5G1_9AGAM|nr:copper radical oxidase [Heliocybe sulcata]